MGSGKLSTACLPPHFRLVTPAENATQAETTGSFSADVLSPSRIQAAFFFSREDRARMSGLEDALRENLTAGLADGLDKEVLAGTNGLFTGTVVPNHNVTTATTFDLYLAGLVYGRVDGRYASTSSDIKLLMGDHVYGHAGRTFRNTGVDRTVLDRLMEVTSGVMVSAHVPANVSNKQNVMIKPESTDGRRVGGLLKKQKGAPLNLG